MQQTPSCCYNLVRSQILILFENFRSFSYLIKYFGNILFYNLYISSAGLNVLKIVLSEALQEKMAQFQDLAFEAR